MFTLRLLGGLSLESSAGPVPAGALQRRRLALLALLALAGERGVSREAVQAQLWPDSPPDRARHTLDQLLYATRRDLGRDAVLSSATDLRLNPAVVRPDLWAFHEAVRAGRWAEAVDLYAGELLSGQQLVDDADFEQRLDAARGRADQEYGRALEALARSAAARGEHAEAVQWWRRRAAADPLSAPVALDLMRALATAGDPAGAIRHATVFTELVRASLELEPDPAVAALASAIARAPAGASPPPAPVTRRTEGGGSPPPLDGGRLSHAEGDAEGDSEERPPPRAGEAVPAASEAQDRVGPAAFPRPARTRSRLAGAGAVVAVLCSLTAALLVPNSLRAPSRVAAGAPVRAERSPDQGERPADGPPGSPQRTGDPQARTLYLRARASWETRTRPGLEQAVVLYRQATERDPLYADAYTGLAESYAMLGYFGFAPGDAMFPKARAAALRALELDPHAGAAYAALGQALAWEHAWTDAERAYRRALELAPRNPTVHQWYALLLAYVGRAKEAALHTGHASQLDPLSVQINNMHGMMLYYAGDLDGALRQYERTVDAEPDSAWVRQNPWVLSNFGEVATAAGRYDQAVRLLQRSLDVVPTHPRPLLDLAHAYIQMGDTARARAVFARADTTHPHYLVARGSLHALLGEMDEAFAWFDRVDEWALPSLVGLNNNPRFAPLRADPRYRKVRERLGLPPR